MSSRHDRKRCMIIDHFQFIANKITVLDVILAMSIMFPLEMFLKISLNVFLLLPLHSIS